jgi:hypothetical protein
VTKVVFFLLTTKSFGIFFNDKELFFMLLEVFLSLRALPTGRQN